MTIILLIFKLWVGHALCDFALQTAYMAEHKNPFRQPNDHWFWVMLPHCLLHAGAVYFITGSFGLAMAEFGVHFIADYAKCAGKTTYTQDQMFHYGCKIVWGIL
jgi:hypothetical protein